MPQAVVDPEEVREFARHLKKFTNEVRHQINAVNNRLTELGNTWRDQEHKKFATSFEDQSRHLARFLEANDQHVRYLVKKAEQIEQYLDSR